MVVDAAQTNAYYLMHHPNADNTTKKNLYSAMEVPNSLVVHIHENYRHRQEPAPMHFHYVDQHNENYHGVISLADDLNLADEKGEAVVVVMVQY